MSLSLPKFIKSHDAIVRFGILFLLGISLIALPLTIFGFLILSSVYVRWVCTSDVQIVQSKRPSSSKEIGFIFFFSLLFAIVGALIATSPNYPALNGFAKELVEFLTSRQSNIEQVNIKYKQLQIDRSDALADRYFLVVYFTVTIPLFVFLFFSDAAKNLGTWFQRLSGIDFEKIDGNIAKEIGFLLLVFALVVSANWFLFFMDENAMAGHHRGRMLYLYLLVKNHGDIAIIIGSMLIANMLYFGIIGMQSLAIRIYAKL